MASLSPERADILAQKLSPSWVEFFGEPTALPALKSGAADPLARLQGPRSRPSDARSSKRPSTPASGRNRGDAVAASFPEPAVEVPTTSSPWPKVAGGLVALAAIVGLFFALRGGSSEPTPAEKPAATQTKPAPKPTETARTTPPPATAAPPPAPPPADTAKTEPPPPAEPPPPPVAEPPPPKVAQPPPPKGPPPKQPPPKQPPPKGKGGIVRDVPF